MLWTLGLPCQRGPCPLHHPGWVHVLDVQCDVLGSATPGAPARLLKHGNCSGLENVFFSAPLSNDLTPPGEGLLPARSPATLQCTKPNQKQCVISPRNVPKTQLTKILNPVGRRDPSLCFKQGLLGGGRHDPDYPHEEQQLSSLLAGLAERPGPAEQAE